jgi:hypothetical protein
MERVVKKLDLQFSYFVKGKIKTLNIYKQGPFLVDAFQLAGFFRSFSLKIKFLNDHEFRVNEDNTSFTFGQVFKNANGVFRVTRNPYGGISKDYTVTGNHRHLWQLLLQEAYRSLQKLQEQVFLTISMQTPTSQMGADVINYLMKEYGDYSIEQKKQSSDQILEFIDARLAELGHKLDSVQKIQQDTNKSIT